MNENQFWHQVQQLENTDIYTLKRGRRNHVVRVTSQHVEFENRRSRPSREEIWTLYQDVRHNGLVFSSRDRRWTWAVTHAILVYAVPEEVEPVPGKKLGIRLRRQHRD